jgi:hypothetical protein
MMKCLVISALLFTSCARLHHVQLSDIDNRDQFRLQKIDVKVSENGFNLDEAASIAKGVTRGADDKIENIRQILGLFQMGPKTGNPVFEEKYAEGLVLKLYEACPSGKLTGLMAIRESRKYPVISGEIVKIIGYCMKPKKEDA